MRKIRTHHHHIDGKIFSWMTLIMSFGVGMINTVLPNFVKSIVGTELGVSIFYAAMAVLMLVAALISTVLFRKVRRTKIAKYGFLIPAIVLFLFVFITSLKEIAVLEPIRVGFVLFLAMALSLFVRDFAKSRALGEEEGIYYKYHNIGLFFGPLLAGVLGARFSYEPIFIISSLVFVVGLFYFLHQHLIIEHPAITDRKIETKIRFFDNIKTFFSSKGRIKSYFVTLILNLWFSAKHIYIPLYVIASGYLSSMTGIIFGLSIIPFILLEVKVGAYIDKKGIKIPLSIGFGLMAVLLFIIFLNPYPLLNFALLILVSIGAALIEPIQEYVLFRNMSKKEEDDLYGVYMTADPVAYFLAPTIGGITLIFLPFQFIFLVFGIILLFSSITCYSVMANYKD